MACDAHTGKNDGLRGQVFADNRKHGHLVSPWCGVRLKVVQPDAGACGCDDGRMVQPNGGGGIGQRPTSIPRGCGAKVPAERPRERLVILEAARQRDVQDRIVRRHQAHRRLFELEAKKVLLGCFPDDAPERAMEMKGRPSRC